jgi:hypothetical protein
MSRVLAVLGLLVVAWPAAANRCTPGELAGGLHCSCPDIASEIANGTITCPIGPHLTPEKPVLYDLDKPFPPDSAISSFLNLVASPRSECAGLQHPVAVKGQLVVCWGPLVDGCRTMSVPYNSFCIDTADEQLDPLGTACHDPTCQAASTHFISIMNAGAAHFQVCPPLNEQTSCRSTSAGGIELYRFQPGGFCATNMCDGTSPGPDTCVRQWGATFLGFGGHETARGHYDWASGAFRVDYKGRRPMCGDIQTCLGSSGHWTGTFIATPSPQSPNPPPCLTTAGDTCNPGVCMP